MYKTQRSSKKGTKQDVSKRRQQQLLMQGQEVVQRQEVQKQGLSIKFLQQPIIKFKQYQGIANRLIDKQVPNIAINRQKNIIKSTQSQTQTSIVRALHPLSMKNTVAYFQVEVISCIELQCTVNIGLTTKDANPRVTVGKTINSIGFIDGDVFYNKKKVASCQGLYSKDRIGCGINCNNMSFFFTKNNQFICQDIIITDYPANKWTQFYPAVSVLKLNEQIQLHFQKKDFMFKIQEFQTKIQNSIKQSLKQEDSQINTQQIYALISQYMLFNGYKKTYDMMKSKKDQIGFQPIKKLTPNPYVKKSIDLDQQHHQIINQQKGYINQQQDNFDYQNNNINYQKNDINYQQNNIKKQKNNQQNEQKPYQSQDKVNYRTRSRQYLLYKRQKYHIRQRIMSDVHPQMIIQQSLMMQQAPLLLQQRRKQTQFMIQQQINIRDSRYLRKQSNISNISQINDQSENEMKYAKINRQIKNHKIQQQKSSNQQKYSQSQQFLLNQRFKILQLIKKQKIQQAQKIIKQKIPKLYQIQPLLDTYMKGHIFLRTIKQLGSREAIQYARKCPQINENIQVSFPTYNISNSTMSMIPLKKLFGAITKQKSQNHKYLKKQQFEYFSYFINSLILKHMGVMQNSRLGIIIEHGQILLRKINDFKAMTCGIQILL